MNDILDTIKKFFKKNNISINDLGIFLIFIVSLPIIIYLVRILNIYSRKKTLSDKKMAIPVVSKEALPEPSFDYPSGYSPDYLSGGSLVGQMGTDLRTFNENLSPVVSDTETGDSTHSPGNINIEITPNGYQIQGAVIYNGGGPPDNLFKRLIYDYLENNNIHEINIEDIDISSRAIIEESDEIIHYRIHCDDCKIIEGYDIEMSMFEGQTDSACTDAFTSDSYTAKECISEYQAETATGRQWDPPSGNSGGLWGENNPGDKSGYDINTNIIVKDNSSSSTWGQVVTGCVSGWVAADVCIDEGITRSGNDQLMKIEPSGSASQSPHSHFPPGEFGSPATPPDECGGSLTWITSPQAIRPGRKIEPPEIKPQAGQGSPYILHGCIKECMNPIDLDDKSDLLNKKNMKIIPPAPGETQSRSPFDFNLKYGCQPGFYMVRGEDEEPLDPQEQSGNGCWGNLVGNIMNDDAPPTTGPYWNINPFFTCRKQCVRDPEEKIWSRKNSTKEMKNIPTKKVRPGRKFGPTDDMLGFPPDPYKTEEPDDITGEINSGGGKITCNSKYEMMHHMSGANNKNGECHGETNAENHFILEGCFPTCNVETEECLNQTIKYEGGEAPMTWEEFKEKFNSYASANINQQLNEDNIEFFRTYSRRDTPDSELENVIEYQIKCGIGQCNIIKDEINSAILGGDSGTGDGGTGDSGIDDGTSNPGGNPDSPPDPALRRDPCSSVPESKKEEGAGKLLIGTNSEQELNYWFDDSHFPNNTDCVWEIQCEEGVPSFTLTDIDTGDSPSYFEEADGGLNYLEVYEDKGEFPPRSNSDPFKNEGGAVLSVYNAGILRKDGQAKPRVGTNPGRNNEITPSKYLDNRSFPRWCSTFPDVHAGFCGTFVPADWQDPLNIGDIYENRGDGYTLGPPLPEGRGGQVLGIRGNEPTFAPGAAVGAGWRDQMLGGDTSFIGDDKSNWTQTVTAQPDSSGETPNRMTISFRGTGVDKGYENVELGKGFKGTYVCQTPGDGGTDNSAIDDGTSSPGGNPVSPPDDGGADGSANDGTSNIGAVLSIDASSDSVTVAGTPTVAQGDTLQLTNAPDQVCLATPKKTNLVVDSVSDSVITFAAGTVTQDDPKASTNCVLSISGCMDENAFNAATNGATVDDGSCLCYDDPEYDCESFHAMGGSNSCDMAFCATCDRAQKCDWTCFRPRGQAGADDPGGHQPDFARTTEFLKHPRHGKAKCPKR